MYWDIFSNAVAFPVRACVLAMDICIYVYYIYVIYVCLSTCYDYEGKLFLILKGTHSTTQWILSSFIHKVTMKIEMVWQCYRFDQNSTGESNTPGK